MKSDRAYLLHILECLTAIADYTAGGLDTFQSDRKTQKACLRELQELAESTQRLSAPSKATHPEISWGDIAAFRNVLVHEYLGLSIPRLSLILHRDLAPLRAAVEAMLEALPEE